MVGSYLYLFILILAIIKLTTETKITNGEPYITSNECVSKEGTIVNTLGGEGCKSRDTFLGTVTGLKCPCVCCKE